MKENKMKPLKENNSTLFFDKKIANDYKGDKHIITICAIVFFDSYFYDDDCDINVGKLVYFGYSVQNCADKYDENIGNLIAYNRALKSKQLGINMVCSTEKGTLNNNTIKNIMADKLSYWQSNIGVLIPGYTEAEKKYKEKVYAKDKLSKMNYSQLSDTELLATATSKDIEDAKTLYKYIKDENITENKITDKKN